MLVFSMSPSVPTHQAPQGTFDSFSTRSNSHVFPGAGLGHSQSVKIPKKCQQVARLPDTGLDKARQTDLSPLSSFTGLQCPVYVINL